jgi:hypothetical protein
VACGAFVASVAATSGVAAAGPLHAETRTNINMKNKARNFMWFISFLNALLEMSEYVI